jgi:hypothetical protein
MADVQILAQGTQAAPLDYPVPPTSEILLRAAGATFDGTGAAGAFLPAIVITPPSGVPLPPFVTDTAVAAGSSAEVAFAPFLRGVTASTPSTSGGLPNCVRTDETGQTVPRATEQLLHWHDANDFGTTDAAIFAEDSFAAHTIYLSATGLYLAWCHIDFGSFQDPLLVGAGIRWADHGALWPQISPQRLIDTDSGINGQYNAGNTPPSSYYLDVISYAYLSDATAPGAQLQVWFNNEDPVNASDLAAYVLTVWQIQPISAATLAGFPTFHF